MASHLISYLSGPSEKQSVDLRAEADAHQNLLSFLAIAQKYSVDFLPITWQSALEPFGEGGTAKISQAVVNIQMSLAFKRTKLSTDSPHSTSTAENEHRVYRALISELMVLEHPIIKEHPNVLKLEGICWEISKTKPEVVPVLVFEKAPLGDLESHLLSERGKRLNFTEKRNVCADIMQSIAILHSCHVVHGDIKPKNVLLFQDDAENMIAKMADFGYSAIFADRENRINIPESRPWQAPEHHHRGLLFSEAQKMDIFGLGMVCLWILFGETLQRGDVELQSWEGVPMRGPIPFTHSKDNFELVEDLKDKDLLPLLSSILLNQNHDLGEQEKRALKKLFELTLCRDPSTRASEVGELPHLRIEKHPKYVTRPVISIDIVKDVDETHETFSVCRSLFQLARTDYRVRRRLVAYLDSVAIDHPCSGCAANAEFESAVCWQLGLGGIKGDRSLPAPSMRPESLTSALDVEIEKIKQSVKYISFRNERIEQLDQAANLTIVDYAHEYRLGETSSLHEVEFAHRREIQSMGSALGHNHVVIYLLKSILVSVIKGTGDTIRPDAIEEELLMELTDDPDCGPDHPFTIKTAGNLAFSYRQRGHWDKAEQLLKKLMERISGLLGDEHLSYIDCMSNLAYTYQEQGRFPEAVQIYTAVAQRRSKVLGNDHPSTLLPLGSLAAVYRLQGRWKEGEKLERRLLELHTRMLGKGRLID
ncbi:MAG: hypothetical protein Q9224_004970 [Gallowayella concinna]